MTSNTPFLTAEWKELTLLNFALAPKALECTLPTGLIPDLLEGQAWASLVAFDFAKIRVGGIPWPGYTEFPEFNLRVYVRCAETGMRGVMFVRELIPARLPCLMARWLYNEPYTACPMQRQILRHEDGSQTQFTTIAWNGQIIQLQVDVGPATLSPERGSWFKEQQWGFGLTANGGLLRYHVAHPRWLLREVRSWSLQLDWMALYGPYWAELLGHATPASVLHAIGSEVAVYPPAAVPQPTYS